MEHKKYEKRLIVFDSNFDSGNMKSVEKVSDLKVII